MNYYNEFDPKAAAWLRQLIADGLIPQGTVDERSITDVRDLNEATQRHWFAGIGGWAKAFHLAGWEENRPAWSASCPCQPFSCAGKQLGEQDDRHLWPTLLERIKAEHPPVIFGEQVASAAVVGRANSPDENLQEMQDREAVFRVLRQLERQSPAGLQGVLQERRAAAEAPAPGTDVGKIPTVEGHKEGLCFGERGQESGKGQGYGIRPEPAEHSGPDRCGSVRTDGHIILPGASESLECAVSRSDRLKPGIHAGQREGDSVCGQCDGEHLGAAEDFRDCVGDHGAAQESFKRFVRETWAVTPEALEPVWLDGIRSDLEAEGYTFGAVVLGAHSVGAPHIRQRLYWVAHTEHPQRRPQHGPEQDGRNGKDSGRKEAHGEPGTCGEVRRVGDAAGDGRDERWTESSGRGDASGCGNGGVGDTINPGLEGHAGNGDTRHQPGRDAAREAGPTAAASATGGVDNAAQRTELEGITRIVQPPGENILQKGFWSDAIWHPCRDGKQRRIPKPESIFKLESDGIWSMLGTGWNIGHVEIQKAILTYAKTVETGTGEILRAVWCAVEEKALRGDYRGHDGIPSPEILLFALCQLAGNKESIFDSATQNLREMREATMRVVWFNETPSRPPHKPELARSSTGEPENTLPELPSSQGTQTPEGKVLCVRPGCSPSQNVSDALSAVEEVWRSFVNQGANQRDVSTFKSVLEAAASFPLAKSIPGRVGLLRGAGNAIVPELAALFVQSAVEAIAYTT